MLLRYTSRSLLSKTATKTSPFFVESAPSSENESVVDRIAAVQWEKLEQEIAGLKVEAERVAEEARELAGEVPF